MIQLSKPALQRVATALTLVISAGVFATTAAMAQNQQMDQKLIAFKEAQEANKAKLAQYTWTETETISIKGDVKDVKTYQVQMVNGKPQKTETSNQAAAPSGGREGRIRERVVDKKKQEYQEYGQSISALAKQYTTPNPEALMQAKQAGNISLQLGPGTVSLVIKNYVKPGDSVTMTVDQQTHAPVSAHVNSYLSDPKDAVTINAEFAQLPDGTNHVASTLINGVSKQLTVSDVNSNYQKQ